ncbi:MAG: hypothetical protein JWR50_3517 [Mucilaginibacter sp.]|nr:hypothetical protein [Mucilaginibacter sp.]
MSFGVCLVYKGVEPMAHYFLDLFALVGEDTDIGIECCEIIKIN